MATYHKTYGLRIASFLLLLLGGAALYLGHHNPAIGSLAGIAIVASVYLGRISRRSDPFAGGGLRDSRATVRPGRWLWIVSLALLLLAAASLINLYSDALHGGHEVWPVDVFAGIALACAIVWSYLFMKIMR